MHHDDDADELFQTLLFGNADRPALCLLELHRLMALTQAWGETAGLRNDVLPLPASHARVVSDAPIGPKPGCDRFAAFRIGDAFIGLRAGDVGELLPTPELQPVVPTRSGTRGICKWRGRLVPVVDLTATLNAAADPAPPPWLCIVTHAGLALGLLVHDVQELFSVDTSGLVGKSRAPDDVILGNAVIAAAPARQLIDTAGLMRRYPESHIGAARPADAPARPSADGPDSGSYLVFVAGTAFAAPTEAIQEIITLPDALWSRIEAGLSANVEWRGQVLPLVDLRRELPNPSHARATQLVVVRREGRFAAVAIDRVTSLIPAQTATRRRLSVAGVTGFDMVTLDNAEQRASYAVLDLAQFVT